MTKNINHGISQEVILQQHNLLITFQGIDKVNIILQHHVNVHANLLQKVNTITYSVWNISTSKETWDYLEANYVRIFVNNIFGKHYTHLTMITFVNTKYRELAL